MYHFGPVFLYSRFKPTEIQKELFSLCIQGSPIIINSKIENEIWGNEIIDILCKGDQRSEILIISHLKRFSGLFSLIFNLENEVILATDIIRSYPIFYGYNQNGLFITDNLYEFQKEIGSLEIDGNEVEDFLATGLVYGNKTIYKNVYGLQAGEMVTIRSNEIKSSRYFVFKPTAKSVFYNNRSEVTVAFDTLFISVFSRMIEQNPPCTRWVVPLSGGHDSRLIVNYLYRLGIKNVICFSYGSLDNEQSRISKQVSEAVGYEWHFVEYTEHKWQALHDSGLFVSYIKFAHNGVSTPHLQDFLAIYELKTKGIIKENDIILPGHTAVTVDAFHEITLSLKTPDDAIKYVYLKNRRINDSLQQANSLYSTLQNIYKESKIDPENFNAFCDWQELKAKFITNSIRTYEFMGFKSQLPLWDRELADFWLSLPSNDRFGREPVYETEKNGGLVECLLSIPFASDHKNSTRPSFVRIMKKVIPSYLITKLLRVTRRKAKLSEGLNQIYALRANSVKELLEPIGDFPEQTVQYFQDYLDRYPYQIDPNILTSLYTIRQVLT